MDPFVVILELPIVLLMRAPSPTYPHPGQRGASCRWLSTQSHKQSIYKDGEEKTEKAGDMRNASKWKMNLRLKKVPSPQGVDHVELTIKTVVCRVYNKFYPVLLDQKFLHCK